MVWWRLLTYILDILRFADFYYPYNAGIRTLRLWCGMCDPFNRLSNQGCMKYTCCLSFRFLFLIIFSLFSLFKSDSQIYAGKTIVSVEVNISIYWCTIVSVEVNISIYWNYSFSRSKYFHLLIHYSFSISKYFHLLKDVRLILINLQKRL